MAKYLGIDYGSKRVGVAVSDESGTIAFPRGTFSNDSTLIPTIIDLVRDEGIDLVIVGESKDKDGNDNPVMAEARRFVLLLENQLAVTIYFEPEYYSSVEARQGTEDSQVDAQAAAIILNRYLERIKNNPPSLGE